MLTVLVFSLWSTVIFDYCTGGKGHYVNSYEVDIFLDRHILGRPVDSAREKEGEPYLKVESEFPLKMFLKLPCL